MEKNKKILKLILLVLFFAVIAFITIKYTPIISSLITHPEKFKKLINSYGIWGPLIFILFQISHIIIVVIPGELIQVGGGSIFGTFWGTVYEVIGTIIGTLLVFGATRLFGYSLIKSVINEKTLKKFDFILNNPKADIIYFVFFLIPGLPKDALIYIAALTPINAFKFLAISLVARFPGLLGSAYMGAKASEGEIMKVAIVAGISITLFVLGIIFRDKIINKLSGLTSKKENK